MVQCVLCHLEPAVVYCYNDNANLCLGCDNQIHKTNKLAWRHQRVNLCELCENAANPATVYCIHDKVRRAGISAGSGCCDLGKILKCTRRQSEFPARRKNGLAVLLPLPAGILKKSLFYHGGTTVALKRSP